MSKWISVKDRLPEDNQMVLIYPLTTYPGVMLSGWYRPKSRRWVVLTIGDVLEEEITHWRDSPKPPEDSK